MRYFGAGGVFLLASMAWAQDNEGLGKAAAATQQLESYTYEVEFQVQGGPGNRNAPKIGGTFHKVEGFHLRIGDHIEAVKKGKKIVHTDESRNWRVLDADKPPEGSEGERRRRDWQRSMLKNIRAPHEELAGIETKFKQVLKAAEKERIDEQECDVYSGELTPEGTKELFPNPILNRASEFKGAAKIWTNDKGVIVKFEIDVEASGEMRGRPYTVSFSRAVVLTHLNQTKSDIPEEARKLLEEKIDTPSSDK